MLPQADIMHFSLVRKSRDPVPYFRPWSTTTRDTDFDIGDRAWRRRPCRKLLQRSSRGQWPKRLLQSLKHQWRSSRGACLIFSKWKPTKKVSSFFLFQNLFRSIFMCCKNKKIVNGIERKWQKKCNSKAEWNAIYWIEEIREINDTKNRIFLGFFFVFYEIGNFASNFLFLGS